MFYFHCRSPPRFPGNTQPSAQQGFQGYGMMGNPRSTLGQGHQTSSSPLTNATGNPQFRTTPNNNMPQHPLHHNERPPPLFPSDVPPPPLFHGERPPPPILPGDRSAMPMFPGDRHPPPMMQGDRPPPIIPGDIQMSGINQVSQGDGKSPQEMSDMRQQAQFRLRNPGFPGFPPNQNLQPKAGSGPSVGQNPNMDQFQQNQMNQFFANRLKGPAGYQGNQTNFSQAPGTERLGMKQQQDSQPQQPPQHPVPPMPPFANPLINPLAAFMSRFNSPRSNFSGSLNQGMEPPQRPPMTKMEDFKSSPMDILGALSQLAIQVRHRLFLLL